MSKKYSIELKRAIVECGQLKEYSKATKRLFVYGDPTLLKTFIRDYGEDVYKCCKSISDGKYRKVKRMNERFAKYANQGFLFFGTLTFTDHVLDSTSKATRRAYVRRVLKDHFALFVANIDFGDKKKNPDSNEREHYHFIGVPLVVELPWVAWVDSWWQYGFSKIKRVIKNNDSRENSKVVSKYVAKLGYHALKDGVKIPSLIWSRGFSRRKVAYFDAYFDLNGEALPF